jgi:putative flippase GtrA
MSRSELQRAARYAVVGASNVVLDFAVYSLLVVAGVWYPVAKVASMLVAIANGYTLSRRWAFRAGPHRHAMLARYSSVTVASLVLNLALLAALVEGAGVHEIVAQAIVLPFLAFGNFLAQRLWTFAGAVS